MFGDLLSRLFSRQPTPLPELDTKLALAALLVRAAKADGNYAVQEIGKIDRILAKTFELNPVEAAKMRATAEKLEHAAPDDDKFADAICASVDQETREGVLAALWQVALADGHRRPEEESFFQLAAAHFGVDAAAMARARDAAHGGTVAPSLPRESES